MPYTRTALLLAGLTGLFLVLGYLLGGEAGLVLAFALAAAGNLFAYWNADKMVLAMTGARAIGRGGDGRDGNVLGAVGAILAAVLAPIAGACASGSAPGPWG